MRGIGNDIIEVDRIQKTIERHGSRFLERIFTKKERDYCSKFRESARHYAGRFAAKEAVVKALGIGFTHGISWHDVEIVNDDLGKPHVLLSEKVQSLFNDPDLMISISHCHSYATAIAVLI